MNIKNKFDIEQIVYLKTDPEQYKRIIIGLYVVVGHVVTYMLQCGGEQSEHIDFEISTEKELQL